MHVAHAIVAHAVLAPLVVILLAAVVLTALRRGSGSSSGRGAFGDPLDLRLVERWNLRPH